MLSLSTVHCTTYEMPVFAKRHTRFQEFPVVERDSSCVESASAVPGRLCCADVVEPATQRAMVATESKQLEMTLRQRGCHCATTDVVRTSVETQKTSGLNSSLHPVVYFQVPKEPALQKPCAR